jgi:hypothetical protein
LRVQLVVGLVSGPPAVCVVAAEPAELLGPGLLLDPAHATTNTSKHIHFVIDGLRSG